jgi:CDP-diacylglycerol--serine O-phosphatidyltransferase
MLVESTSLSGFGTFGRVTAFAYAAAGALRLARFNVLATDKSSEAKRFFVGLPIPVASSALVVFVAFSTFGPLWVAAATWLLAGLMVSNLPFRTFKVLDRRATLWLFGLAVITLVSVAIFGPLAFEFAFAGYFVLALLELRVAR